MHNFRALPLLFILTGNVLLSSCSSQTVQQFGPNSEYYMGLRCMQENNEVEAIKHFRNCTDSGSGLAARRSADALTQMGNVQERIAACADLVKKYHDEDALLRSASELTEDKEYGQVVQQTNDIDITVCNNKLVWFKLNAMQQKGDTRLAGDVFKWFTTRTISAEHYRFYAESLSGDQKLFDKNQQAIISFRIAAYRKSYISAYKQLSTVISIIDSDGRFVFTEQLISDMGKVSLYGSSLWSKNANFFDELAERAESSGNKENAFYARFYAARLYDKGSDYYALAVNRYNLAIADSNSPEDFDNCLWYRLNMDLSVSTDNAITTLQEYCTKWHDPSYFTDFFDTLSVLLLSRREWNAFYKVYNIINGYADDSTTAKYAYLSGRLIESHLADAQTDSKAEAQAAFTSALKSGSGTYYKTLAAYELGLTGSNLEKVFCDTRINKKFKADADMEKFLSGYAVYGLPQFIYPEWQRISDTSAVSLDCAIDLSKFLRGCDDTLLNHYPQSIRIISNVAGNSDKPLTREALELIYPQNFKEQVTRSSSKYALPEYLVYAMIRSESLFDPDIESYAGATGLTQLMESTAADIAKKLKKPVDYDLTDPTTNIEFGTYYLHSLIQRLDNSDLLALFAYNSGITHVKTWVSDARLELGSGTKLPMDLFLETIPFSETRDYGRKVVSAAVLYGWLYYDTDPATVIKGILK